MNPDNGGRVHYAIRNFVTISHLYEALDVEIRLKGLDMLDEELWPDLGEEVGGSEACHDAVGLAG